MFTQMRSELRELVDLTVDIARYDATLAAKPEIRPTTSSLDERRRKEMRKLELMEKYELLGHRHG